MSDEVQAEVEVQKVKRTRKDYGIEDVEFIDAWQKAQTAKEASTLLTDIARRKGKISQTEEMPRSIVLARAAVYRAKGIKLKKMGHKNPRRLDVNKLNARIAESENKTEV
jgi:hypothetical protein